MGSLTLPTRYVHHGGPFSPYLSAAPAAFSERLDAFVDVTATEVPKKHLRAPKTGQMFAERTSGNQTLTLLSRHRSERRKDKSFRASRRFLPLHRSDPFGPVFFWDPQPDPAEGYNLSFSAADSDTS